MSSPTATPPVEGNLSEWVSQIQERHRGSGDVNAPEPGEPVSSAAELEEEIRRSRAERAKRRSQQSGEGGGGGALPLSPLQTGGKTPTSGEETLRRLLGEKGIASPKVQDNSMKTLYTPPSLSTSSPPKRSNALLDRYGGASGPTGVARAGTSDSPVSLASFMGGKASGPRLGKLEGDGRSAPPELSMIDDSYRRGLPGMRSGAGGGATPLATFLEARAGGYSSSPATANAPSHATSLPTARSSATAARPIIDRAGSAEQASRSMAVNTQTEHPSSGRSDMATSPLKADQISASKELSPSKRELDKLPRTAASSSLAPASMVHSPTSDAVDRFSASQQAPFVPPATATETINSSPAFQSTQYSNERMPTASLTRLRSKKMVEQRVKEAQGRAGADVSPSTSPAIRSAPAWISSTPQDGRQGLASEGTGGAAHAMLPNVNQSPSPTLETRGTYAPAKFGNALPGLGQSTAAPNRSLYAANKREIEERSDEYAPPVRLPGMGSAQSPFASRQTTAESEELDPKPLEQLAKGRAKPRRATTRVVGAEVSTDNVLPAQQPAEERMGKESFSAVRGTFSQPVSSSRGPQRPSVETNVAPPTALRQDSNPIPDSAERRIADSTAALEALLEGKTVRTPTFEASKNVFGLERTARTGTLKIAKNKDSHISIDTSTVLRSAGKPARGGNAKTISVEVMCIAPSGALETLQGEEKMVLYETETQVITHRYKESLASGLVVTRVYARTGRMARLLVDASCAEAKKVQEIGRQHRADVVDARQGRESVDLAKLLGGKLVTREGSRKRYETGNTCLYEVRGVEGAHFIDQVDLLAASLCSAHSAVVTLMGDVFVWHGVGSTSSIRQCALQCANHLRDASPQPSPITQYEEGEEDELFWTCFDRDASFSNAWHHRFRPLLAEAELPARLYSVQGAGNAKRLAEHPDFSLLDVRRDGVAILQLALELYVLVGPDARPRRKEIHACIDAASCLASDAAQRRGPHLMTPPVHVVVFPSVAPRELKSAFRYWHDEHLNGKGWQRAGLGMNVWEKRAALEQLECNEFPLWQLNDELFLPVGVGLEDVQGIDV